MIRSFRGWSLLLVSSVSVFGLVACAEETPIQQQIREAEEASENSSVSAETLEEEGAVLNESIGVAENFYRDLVSFDFPVTPENTEDINNRLTYREVEDLVGEPIFSDPNYPYDVRIPLDNLPVEKSDEVVSILEEKYKPPVELTNYNNLTNTDKILFNLYLGIEKKELSLLDDVDDIFIDREQISIDENGDIIIPAGAVKYKTNADDTEGQFLQISPIRLYENQNGDWAVDSVDYIFNFFSPIDPSIPQDVIPEDTP